MPSCTIKFCTNNSTTHKKSDGISFHKFPTELQRKLVWISIVRKNRFENNWNPSKFSLVCSNHFEDCDMYFTKKGRRRVTNVAIPKKNLYTRKPGTVALEISTRTNEQLDPIGNLNRLHGDLVQPESAIDFQNGPPDSIKSEDELDQDARPGTPIGFKHEISYSPDLTIKLEDTPLASEELIRDDCLNRLSGSLVPPESLIVFQNAPLVSKNVTVDEFGQDARPGIPINSKHVPVDCLSTPSGGLVQPESLIVLQTMPLDSHNMSEDEVDQDARPGTFIDSNHVLDAVTSIKFRDVSRNYTSDIPPPAMERSAFPMLNFENSLSISYLENKIKKQNNQITNYKKKIITLNQKVRRFKKNIVSLRNMIKNLKKHNISFLHNESIVAADMFNVLYRKNKKKNITYSPALKEFCQTLNKYSPKAYEYTRQSFNTCLPHPKTLGKWKVLGRSESGLAEEIFHANSSNTTLDHSSDESDISDFPDTASDTSQNI